MTASVVVPPYLELYAYSAVGALLLWIKLTVQKKKVHGLGDIFEQLFPKSPKLQYVLQFIFFVLFGGFIGVLFVGPYTHLQAVAGGVAWSRLAAKD